MATSFAMFHFEHRPERNFACEGYLFMEHESYWLRPSKFIEYCDLSIAFFPRWVDLKAFFSIDLLLHVVLNYLVINFKLLGTCRV